MSHTIPKASNTEERIGISDLHEFVMILSEWHQKQVKTLKHVMEIPEGTVMHVEGQPDITLTGEVLQAFIMGISVSIAEMGTLPFEVEFTQVSDAIN